MCYRAGTAGSGSLLARSYLTWGRKSDKPVPGCVGIWPRGKSWQGHTGIVEKVNKTTVTLISGNQNNAVTRKNYPVKTALGWRLPPEVSAKGEVGMPDTDKNLVTEVPVVNPNWTSDNWVAIVTVITAIVMFFHNQMGLPLTEADVGTIMSAGAMLYGVYLWVKNRWFSDVVTKSTAVAKGLKLVKKR